MILKYTPKLLDMSQPVILRNAIMTPDGTILHSTSRWDRKSHTDTINGFHYTVDGGNDYIRRSGSEFTDLTVTTHSLHAEIREVFEWTSKLDKDLNPIPPVKKKLSELTDDHIVALVDWVSEGYPNWVKWVIFNEHEYRLLGIHKRVKV